MERMPPFEANFRKIYVKSLQDSNLIRSIGRIVRRWPSHGRYVTHIGDAHARFASLCSTRT